MIEGMGIDFMTGAVLLSTLRMGVFLFFLWIMYRSGKKIWTFANDDSNDAKTPNLKWEIVGLAAIFMFAIFFGSAAQPRLTIETAPDRELIEYQRNDDDIVIETPAPRTETLDGFTPMNQ